MDPNRKFLYRFSHKPALLKYLYAEQNLALGDSQFDSTNRRIRNIQIPWTDITPKKAIFDTPSLLLAPFRFFLPYALWLKLLPVSAIRPVIRIDRLLLNIYILARMALGRYDVFFRTSKDIFRVTERLLGMMDKTVMQYDGTAVAISGTDLSTEISMDRKFLVSNMDWREQLGFRHANFRQILLGVDRELGQGVDFDNRDIDVLFIGTISDIWKKRCECLEYLLARASGRYRVQIHGYNRAGPSYPTLRAQTLTPAYGDQAIALMRRARLTINIPSEEHLAIACGMPTRTYEAAAFGVTQLVYVTDAMSVTRFKPGLDYIPFASKEEMIDRIDYYLAHDDERCRIAKHANETFLKFHTAQQCFKALLDSIDDLNGSD